MQQQLSKPTTSFKPVSTRLKAMPTPLDVIRRCRPHYQATIALLEQTLAEAEKDVEKTALLVKARRLATVSRNIIAPSYLQDRVTQGQPLPQVQLVPLASGTTRAKERERNRHGFVAFLLGMEGGPENAGMSRDVFRVVMDLLMSSWDPLRRKNTGTGPPAQQG